MLLGSPAITSSLALALKVHAHVPTPALLDDTRQIPHQKTAAVMKRTWMPRTTAPGREQIEDSLEDHDVHMASTPLYWRTAGVRPPLEIK